MNRDEKARLAREQSRRIASDSTLRRQLTMADNGRLLAWVVEWAGVAVAMLSDPTSKDDHWPSYEILPLTNDPRALRTLETTEFWMNPHLVYRNSGLNLVATRAFAAGEGPSKGRISVYGLDFEFRLSLADKLHLLFRRYFPSAGSRSHPT